MERRFEMTRTTALSFVTLWLIASTGLFAQSVELPPLEMDALAHLESSPRHGEWVTVSAGGGDRVEAYLVYPERRDPAPVVIVIHEIFGLTDWARAVADQLAAEGFLAVAPDFLSGKGPGGKGSASLGRDEARTLNSSLQPAEVVRRLNAVADYATGLPAASDSYGVVGFCWGGGMSYRYATEQPNLDAAVVYYGVSPDTSALARVRAPVLGLYGGEDARVNATIPKAREEMNRLGKRYEVEIYEGAGHAFLRQQDAREGANLRAARMAWPRTVQFLKTTLGDRVSLAEATPVSSTEAAALCFCEAEPAHAASLTVALQP
jgi:carboxymethylenebutenolidase